MKCCVKKKHNKNRKGETLAFYKCTGKQMGGLLYIEGSIHEKICRRLLIIKGVCMGVWEKEYTWG